jgi:hypothetical protein
MKSTANSGIQVANSVKKIVYLIYIKKYNETYHRSDP